MGYKKLGGNIIKTILDTFTYAPSSSAASSLYIELWNADPSVINESLKISLNMVSGYYNESQSMNGLCCDVKISSRFNKINFGSGYGKLNDLEGSVVDNYFVLNSPATYKGGDFTITNMTKIGIVNGYLDIVCDSYGFTGSSKENISITGLDLEITRYILSIDNILINSQEYFSP